MPPRSRSHSFSASMSRSPSWLSLCQPSALIFVTCVILVFFSPLTRHLLSNINPPVDEFLKSSDDSSIEPAGFTEKCPGLDGRVLPLVMCCGHRGARRFAPENTISSFKKALQLGANCIELDVHRTKDGHLAVLHERTIRQKVLNGSTSDRVEEMPFSFLTGLDAGGWFSPKYKGEKISTLSEVVKFLWDTPLMVVVELKYEQCSGVVPREDSCLQPGEWERMYAVSIAEWLVSERGPEAATAPKVGLLFSSFNHILIDFLAEEIRKYSSGLGTMETSFFGLAYIFGPRDNTTLDNWHEDVKWILPHDSMVERLAPEHLGRHRIISWVTDSLPLMKRQLAMGASAVTTNNPSLCPNLCADET